MSILYSNNSQIIPRNNKPFARAIIVDYCNKQESWFILHASKCLRYECYLLALFSFVSSSFSQSMTDKADRHVYFLLNTIVSYFSTLTPTRTAPDLRNKFSDLETTTWDFSSNPGRPLTEYFHAVNYGYSSQRVYRKQTTDLPHSCTTLIRFGRLLETTTPRNQGE